MRTFTRYAAAFGMIGSVVLLTGCTESITENIVENAIENEAGENVDIDMDGGRVRVETDEGTFETNGALPENWPEDAPVYPDSTVVFAGTSNPATGQAGMGATLTTEDSAQKVWDFYESKLPEDGWTVSTTIKSGGTNLLGAEKGEKALSVMISEGDLTTIVIGIGSVEDR